MSSSILISIRLHDGRYYGTPDWPPSPARLFQALVAGAGLTGPLGKTDSDAFRWLEEKCASAAPTIGAPAAWRGQQVILYVPDNDFDFVYSAATLEVQQRHLGKIRKEKYLRPRLFDASVPFLYAWSLNATEEHGPHAQMVCALAERLYQFGRGVDMAWAWGELLDDSNLEEVWSNYPGRIYRPSSGTGELTLECPAAGSLCSLRVRYNAYSRRFEPVRQGKRINVVFTREPRPRFRTVAYESPPSRDVYELRGPSGSAPYFSWPLVRATELVEHLRDGVLERLRGARPSRAEEIARVLVGRKADGSNSCPIEARVRIIPLPSIGHVHADRAIRRVLVEVPTDCPLDARDVHWAFSGLELVDHETGEVVALVTPARDNAVLDRYGVGDGRSARTWRSVTAVALPQAASRRRVEPSRKIQEAKGGRERLEEEVRAAISVRQALRHAYVTQPPKGIRLQREPFEGNGARVEGFADGTRFLKERLWHVEISFDSAIPGPLVIGDGRFLGLGLMVPVLRTEGIHAFAISSGVVSRPEPLEVARALRRAVMARVRDALGISDGLPAFFSGHEREGSPAHGPHLSFALDPIRLRLLIMAPHVLDRREPTWEEGRQLSTLGEALEGLTELHAGSAGKLTLSREWIDPYSDPLMIASSVWESVTPYLVTRHATQASAGQALVVDLRSECRRRGLPEPIEVRSLEARGVPNAGLTGHARLTFALAVKGPIFLGRSRYQGGGIFAPVFGESGR